MNTLLFILLATVCYVQCATLLDLKNLQSKPPCDLACSKDQCCIQFMAPIVSKKRSAFDQYLPYRYPSLGGGYIKSCQAIKKLGDRCLVRNDGEWCDCALGLKCKANGPTGMDAYYGTCQM